MTNPSKVDVNEIFAGIAADHATLLEEFDLNLAVERLGSMSRETPYYRVPGEVTQTWKQISAEFGERGFAAFQKLTMLRFIEQFDQRAAGRGYSDSVLERFRYSLRRILASIQDQAFEKYSDENDTLLKDLAICSQKVFPAGGARVVEPAGGFPRSLLIRGGLRQTARVASLLMRCGGSRPFYRHHTHTGELKEFNPRGFTACNLRLADMLRMHPDVKGTLCGSWLYDPALKTVSPKLAYMRELQENNGAVVAFSEVSIDGGALLKSKPRQELYEKGEYLPRSYYVIWPRRELLAWADRESEHRRKKEP